MKLLLLSRLDECSFTIILYLYLAHAFFLHGSLQIYKGLPVHSDARKSAMIKWCLIYCALVVMNFQRCWQERRNHLYFVPNCERALIKAPTLNSRFLSDVNPSLKNSLQAQERCCNILRQTLYD